MKKHTIIAAAFALFLMASCSSDGTNSTTATTDEHGHEHQEGMAAAGSVVVEAPEFTSVPEPMTRNVSQLLDQYFELKNALVASDAGAAQSAANTVLASANAMPVATLSVADQKSFAEEQVAQIKNASSAMASVSDIKVQRQHLEHLSEATFAMAKAFGATDDKLYYQHCPMALDNKGGYWLSKNEEIRNPYFGESMLKCGSNEEVYN